MLCFLFPKSFNANSTVFLFFRSSLPQVFCKKGVLRNLAKFTGKYLCHSLFFFDKVAGLRPALLLKKKLWRRCFPVNFVKFLRTPFLTEYLRWLLLFFQMSLLLLPIRFTLRYLPPPLLYFSVFNCVIRRSFLQKKKEEKNIYRKS